MFVEGLMVRENAESGVHEFAHNRAADGQWVKIPGLENERPTSEWLAPTLGSSSGHEEGFS